MALSEHEVREFSAELLEICHVEAHRAALNGDGHGAVRWRLRFYALRTLCRATPAIAPILLPSHLESFPE